jgi:hypothetical protein
MNEKMGIKHNWVVTLEFGVGVDELAGRVSDGGDV